MTIFSWKPVLLFSYLYCNICTYYIHFNANLYIDLKPSKLDVVNKKHAISAFLIHLNRVLRIVYFYSFLKFRVSDCLYVLNIYKNDRVKHVQLLINCWKYASQHGVLITTSMKNKNILEPNDKCKRVLF